MLLLIEGDIWYPEVELKCWWPASHIHITNLNYTVRDKVAVLDCCFSLYLHLTWSQHEHPNAPDPSLLKHISKLLPQISWLAEGYPQHTLTQWFASGSKYSMCIPSSRGVHTKYPFVILEVKSARHMKISKHLDRCLSILKNKSK